MLGPGGVGGLVAAALSHAAGDVTLVARPETATTIAASGLSVRSPLLGEFVARVPTVEAVTSPVDCLIVATKSTGLDDALERVAPTSPRLVVPLLNGIEHLQTLRARFGSERVVAAVIRIESDRLFAACADNTWLEIIEVQLEGKKRLAAAEFLRGSPLTDTAWLGTLTA